MIMIVIIICACIIIVELHCRIIVKAGNYEQTTDTYR